MSAPCAAAAGLEVRIHDDPGRLAALEPEWRALFDAAGAPSPFLSWEWLATFRERLAPRRPLRVVEARRADGTLAGALALAARPGLAGVRAWQLLGNGVAGADGLDVLAHPEAASAARAEIVSALLSAGGWDALDLEDLPCGSPTVTALGQAASAHGVRLRVSRRFACPGFAVRGTWDEHLKRIRRRETFGRRVRWLARQPGFGIDVVTSPAEAAAAMEDLLRLHRARWSAEGGSYGIPPGPLEEFHRAVAPRLAARGWLRLYRLRVAGRAIAAVYGLEVGRRFYYYQSGYDPAWSARSPGMVLVGRTIEDAYARGLDDYDFLRGEEAYKLDWTADLRETCAVRLRAPSLRAGTAAAAEEAFRAARGLARAVAPQRLWAALRRARRSFEVGRAAAEGG